VLGHLFDKNASISGKSIPLEALKTAKFQENYGRNITKLFWTSL
jgi:GTPase SAR1 family protein